MPDKIGKQVSVEVADGEDSAISAIIKKNIFCREERKSRKEKHFIFSSLRGTKQSRDVVYVANRL